MPAGRWSTDNAQMGHYRIDTTEETEGRCFLRCYLKVFHLGTDYVLQFSFYQIDRTAAWASSGTITHEWNLLLLIFSPSLCSTSNYPKPSLSPKFYPANL